jgi:Protein of unknown function (DUF1552)
MARTIGRRALLRGLGGVAVALPALEIMGQRLGGSSARADGLNAPKRYVFCYGAHAIAGQFYDGSAPLADVQNLIVPLTAGADYALPAGLAPIGDFGVKSDVAIVSGLKIPWAVNGVVPAGGRCVEFHYGPSVFPQLSGARVLYREHRPTAPSSDQVVADAIAQGTRYRTLNYLVQAADYYQGSAGSGGDAAKISWKNGEGVDSVVSPEVAYRTLFTGFTPPDPAEAKKAAALLARRMSVLDLVRASSEQLMPKLGKADAARLTQHFDEIRALETRLKTLTPPTASACVQLPDRGEPAFTPEKSESNEDLRAELLCDLIHMGFVCDLSRVATLQFLHWKSYMNARGIIGVDNDVHGISHDYGPGGSDRVTKVLAWQIKHFARLTKKLKDTVDMDGTRLLDNTALVMVFEGGVGFDPEGGSDEHGPHSTENMAALVAGHSGGLKPGKHVITDGMHPAQVVLSAMKSIGVNGPLGEVSGTIPDLFA